MMMISYPIINFIGDWRQAFLVFAIPFFLLSLVLCFIYIPKEETGQMHSDVLAGY